MAGKTIYADESGSTGENLLDHSQPVFAVAAVNIDTETSTSILQRVVAELPTGHGEPKYSSLSRTRRGRQALLRAFEGMPRGAANFYIAHKKFVAEAKMVDLLIENAAYDLGIDINSDGTTVGLANLLHSEGPRSGSGEAYSMMLSSFVGAFRHRGHGSVAELYEAMAAYRDSTSGTWREIFSMFLATRGQAEWIFPNTQDGYFRDTLDPAVPCLVGLCMHIGDNIGSFRIVHDRSNVIIRNALTFMRLNRLPSSTSDGKLLPRIPFTSVEVADSKHVPQLQIADWVAGAGRQWAATLVNNDSDPFASELKSVLGPWLVGALWPDPEAITNRRPWPRINEG
jgi:Protein of unknown function (DUF3800)